MANDGILSGVLGDGVHHGSTRELDYLIIFFEIEGGLVTRKVADFGGLHGTPLRPHLAITVPHPAIAEAGVTIRSAYGVSRR